MDLVENPVAERVRGIGDVEDHEPLARHERHQVGEVVALDEDLDPLARAIPGRDAEAFVEVPPYCRRVASQRSTSATLMALRPA